MSPLSRSSLVICFALSACSVEQGLVPIEHQPPEITLQSPAYGEFLGDESAEVVGWVTPAVSVVTIEGVRVDVDPDGAFSATVSVERRGYRNIDVAAQNGDQRVRERVPVFANDNPMRTWPGGLSFRVLPDGLAHIGVALGALIDDMGWDEQLFALLPEMGGSAFSLVPVGVSHDPTVVELVPILGGIETVVKLRDVTIDYEARFEVFGVEQRVPLSIGYAEIGIGAVAVPYVDDAGVIMLEFDDAIIDMGEAIIELDGFDLEALEFLADAVTWVVARVGDFVLDIVAGGLPALEVGGPFDFTTDVMGLALAGGLNHVYVDPAGLAAELAIGVGEPPREGALGIAAPEAADFRGQAADLGIGVHEGLFQAFLEAGLFNDLLGGFEIPPEVSFLLGTVMTNLPGGDDAPEDALWCMSIDPISAQAARMQRGVEPLAKLFIPDLQVHIGTLDGGACEDWLHASLALEAAVDVRGSGSKLAIDIAVAEGAVLYYGTEEKYDEAEVIAGLGGLMSTAIGVLGGSLQFDLDEIVGGLSGDGTGTDPLLGVLGDVQVRVVASEPMRRSDASAPEGLYAVGVTLWE